MEQLLRLFVRPKSTDPSEKRLPSSSRFLIHDLKLHYFSRGGLGLLGEVVPDDGVELGEVALGELVEPEGGVEAGEVVVVPGGVVVLGDVVELGAVEGVPMVTPPAGTQGRVADALVVPLGEPLPDEAVVVLVVETEPG